MKKIYWIISGLIVLQIFPGKTESQPVVKAAQVVAKPSPVVGNQQSVFDAVNPKTVQVRVGQEVGSGSLLPNSLVVTCNHVVRHQGEIKVRLADQATLLPASVVRQSREHDLAILRVESHQPLPAIAFTESLEPGQTVFALGSPLGKQGQISGGSFTKLLPNGDLQLDVPIKPGNSGGPVVNLDGLQAGVACGVDRQNPAIAFAKPISLVEKLIEGAL